MRDDTKLAEIRTAMKKSEWETALKIASTFSRLGEHKVAIERASEAISRPELYEQMGYDIKLIKEQGINALKQRFNRSWEKVRSQEKDSGGKK